MDHYFGLKLPITSLCISKSEQPFTLQLASLVIQRGKKVSLRQAYLVLSMGIALPSG